MAIEFDFIVVGGGPTATAIMGQLAKMSPTRAFKIAFVEKTDVFGPGFPYSPKNVLPDHLVNIAAGCIDISKTAIQYSELSDFVRWTESLSEVDRTKFDLMRCDTNHFPPRYVVGEYLKQRFREFYLTATQNGISITLISNTAGTESLCECSLARPERVFITCIQQ